MSTVDSVAFLQSRAHIVRDIKNQCVASFAFLVWDSLLMLGDEVEYIWPMPWKLKVKWMYLYLRYVNLAAHLAYLLAISHLTSGYATERTCWAGFAFASATTLLSHMSVEVILALRAYALFSQKTYIAVLLWILMGSEIISTVASFVANNITTTFQVGTACILTPIPKQTLVYRVPALLSHTTIVGLIFFRSRIYGWRRTPIVSLILREGIVVYLSCIALFTLVLVAFFLGSERVYAMTFWAMSILSACGCRLAISLQKLGGRHHDDEEPPQLFTTNIELESTTNTRLSTEQSR